MQTTHLTILNHNTKAHTAKQYIFSLLKLHNKAVLHPPYSLSPDYIFFHNLHNYPQKQEFSSHKQLEVSSIIIVDSHSPLLYHKE